MLDSFPHRLLERVKNPRPVRAEGILECGVESALGLFVKKLVDGMVVPATGQRGRIFGVHLAYLRPFVHRKAIYRRNVDRLRFERCLKFSARLWDRAQASRLSWLRVFASYRPPHLLGRDRSRLVQMPGHFRPRSASPDVANGFLAHTVQLGYCGCTCDACLAVVNIESIGLTKFSSRSKNHSFRVR